MIQVVDFNAIASKNRPLETFFSVPGNIAVITDMMVFECLKREGPKNYRKSFAVFEPYVSRVVILKDFIDLCRLPPKKIGFFDAIVDVERTAAFPEFCRQMLHVSHPKIEDNIRKQQTGVKAFMDKIEKLAADEYRLSIAELEESVPKEDRPNWRAGKPVSKKELAIAKRMVANITTARFKMLFPDQPLPSMDDGMYWVPFRFTVALQALTLKWLRDGGHHSVLSAKMRNDSIDITYVALGTLFEGVISEDAKLQELSRLARLILEYGYGI